LEYILIFCLSLIITAGLSVWDGFVLMKLWAWFVVPMFHLPVLTIVAAVGLGLIVAFLTHQKPADTEENPMATLMISATYSFFHAAMCLAVGWVVTLFM
jgi:hypothetical protein